MPAWMVLTLAAVIEGVGGAVALDGQGAARPVRGPGVELVVTVAASGSPPGPCGVAGCAVVGQGATGSVRR